MMMTMLPNRKDVESKTPILSDIITSKSKFNYISCGGVVIPISEVRIVLDGNSKDYAIRAIIKEMDKHYLMTDRDKDDVFIALDSLE